jgi:hypothetical protein
MVYNLNSLSINSNGRTSRDVVLHSSEQKTPSLRRLSTASESRSIISRNSIGVEELVKRPSQLRPAISAKGKQLPPIPITSHLLSPLLEPTKIQLYDSPVVKTIPLPLTPDKPTLFPLPTPGKSQSPSIRNLDQRSMVKQRLAEMERTVFKSSPTPSPVRSTRLRQTIASPNDSVLSPGRAILLRHGTISSLGQDSIIDSYAGSGSGSPFSPPSTRLASIPSGESVGDGHMSFLARLSRLNAPQAPQTVDIFSPVSRYSYTYPASATKTASPVVPNSTVLKSIHSDPVPEVRQPLSIDTELQNLGTDSSTRPAYAQVRVSSTSMTTPALIKTQALPSVLQAQRDSAPAVSNPSPRLSRASPSMPLPAIRPEIRTPSVATNLEQQARLSSIRNQISEVQSELRRLPETLGAVVTQLPLPISVPAEPTSDRDDNRDLLDVLNEAMERIEDRGECHSQGLAGIQAKVDAVLQLPRVGLGDQPSGISSETVEIITKKLDDMRAQLKSDLPVVAQRLEEFISQRFERISPVESTSAPPPPAALSTQTADDTIKLHERLQEILVAVQASQAVPLAETAPAASGVEEEGDTVQRTLQINPMVRDSFFALNRTDRGLA